MNKHETGELKKLVILHSNDLHGDFLAEEIDSKLVGGVSMLSGYLNKVRSEEDNVLYCIAGDMFRGSVIDSEFKGLSTIELMNALGPDVATIGNHETDYGIAHLLFIEKCASFPIINANLHIRSNNARLFNPCKIIKIDGMKVLFIGVLTEEVLATAQDDSTLGAIIDCTDAATEIGRICNAYNSVDIDLTVLLTHIGFEEDKKLAAMLDPVWGVDLIIGGHSHTLPEEPAVVNGIQIVQAGVGTDQIGRFDLLINADDNCVDSISWRTIPITPENCPRDEAIEKLLDCYKSQTDAKYGRVVTKLARRLTNPARNQETEVGQLAADAVRDNIGVDISLFASGSLRKDAIGPIVTYQDFVEMFGFDEPLYMLTATGKQLKDMLRYTCREETWTGGHTEFYQVSDGIRAVYNRQNHDFDEFEFDGRPLSDDALVSIALQGYHYENFETGFGFDRAELEKNARPRMVATSVVQVIEEYLMNNRRLDRSGTGRLIIK